MIFITLPPTLSSQAYTAKKISSGRAAVAAASRGRPAAPAPAPAPASATAEAPRAAVRPLRSEPSPRPLRAEPAPRREETLTPARAKRGSDVSDDGRCPRGDGGAGFGKRGGW